MESDGVLPAGQSPVPSIRGTGPEAAYLHKQSALRENSEHSKVAVLQRVDGQNFARGTHNNSASAQKPTDGTSVLVQWKMGVAGGRASASPRNIKSLIWGLSVRKPRTQTPATQTLKSMWT